MSIVNKWSQVAQRIEARRAELALPKSEFYEVAMSETTLRNMAKGTPVVRPENRVKICRALNWTDDSIDLMLAGKEPVEVSSPVAGTGSPDLERRVAALERDVSGILRILEVTGAMQEAATNVLEPEPPVQEGAQ
jgi:hypothetical protein